MENGRAPMVSSPAVARTAWCGKKGARNKPTGWVVTDGLSARQVILLVLFFSFFFLNKRTPSD